MENLVPLYTTFSGRISRKTYWLGLVGIAIAAVVLSIILTLVGLGAAWGSLITFVILAVPGLAIAVKRRHDRNNSGNDAIVYYILTFILAAVQALGFGYIPGEANGVATVVPTPTMLVFNIVLGVFAVYMLVVLGFLKGSNGDNQYGADPLGSA